MSGLQAVINGPTTTYKQTKSATKQVILNPELWDFKKKFLKELCQTILDKHVT
jgi:hypothetical protein